MRNCAGKRTQIRRQGVTRSKWFLPSFSLALGLVMLAVSWLGGSPGQGVISLAVLAAFVLIILLAGRSETVRGLRGDGRDALPTLAEPAEELKTAQAHGVAGLQRFGRHRFSGRWLGGQDNAAVIRGAPQCASARRSAILVAGICPG